MQCVRACGANRIYTFYEKIMELEDDYRSGPDIEVDSDVDDVESESQLSQWLGELENYAKGLEPGDTGTVRRRQKTVVTPKMAMESFRYSFLSDNQDVNFDAILGELCELETQLGTSQTDPYYNGRHCGPMMHDGIHENAHDIAQAELDALASEITCSLGMKYKRPELDYFRTHYPGDLGGYSDAMLDIAETDSAFSESASLPSSESFTSMVTVSSSAEAAGMGDAASIGSGNTITPQSLQCDEEQRARLKAEKIRIALEKIKEAKIKKLFVRAFASDGSSKSIMVDEKMTILEVIAILADKNHVKLAPDLAVIEHMPELYMERILEDHDSLVENMAMWTRDTKNRILFESRPQKNALFQYPERYLLVPSSSEKGASLDPKRRENLIQEFFCGNTIHVPEVEGVLYLKSDGKKAWKKYFFVLRASGLYYNPKGKISKLSKDLTCLVQLEFVDLYFGLCWKKKYHAPTDFCFALKHPQIQKKTSKFIRYLCAENKAALDQWIMGIRIAKFGKQLLINFHNLEREILSWDSRDLRNTTTVNDKTESEDAIAELNQQGDLHDSWLSMPSQTSRHSIVNVKNSMLVRGASQTGKGDEVVCLEIDQFEEKLSFNQISEPVRIEKAPVKRVSFSNTNSVIHDTGEELIPVRHRDSITSASTDSSEDSTSSGEGRLGMSHRNSKLRAKLPVTTGTTKQISEMVQTSLDGSTGSMDSSGDDWKPGPPCNQTLKDMAERRKSAPAGDMYNDRKGVGGHGGHVKDQRSMSQTMNYDAMSPTPMTYSPFQNKGPRSMTSPTPQKGYRTHSRGSSISSVDSGDSYQGHMISPTSEIPNPDQPHSSWIQYDESLGNFPINKGPQGVVNVRQGPPTAQKPACIKKTRPQSTPITGCVEKGHKRNTSKSSLESVEEEGTRGPIPVISPLPPRTVSYPAPPMTQAPTPPSYTRSMSQPCPSSIPHNSMYNHSQQTTENDKTPAAAPHTAPNSPLPTSGHTCLSPRLSTHRVLGPKPVTPPVAPILPPTPPALVPSAPRNPDASIKTHKKRPSGGNIVVNGNDAEVLQRSGMCPDIVASTRSLGMPEGQSASDGSNQSGALPFMAELNKKHMHTTPAEHGHIYDSGPSEKGENVHKTPPSTLPKPTEQRLNGNSSHNNNAPYVPCDNNLDHQSLSTTSKQQQQQPQVKKQLPPPPPKRSQSTKLSLSLYTSQLSQSDNSSVPNTPDIQHSDPVYDNCDGILDISDLPPPPPELLEDLHAQNSDGAAVNPKGVELNQKGVAEFQGQRSSGKVKPPPPPPKRNKETHLSTA